MVEPDHLLPIPVQALTIVRRREQSSLEARRQPNKCMSEVNEHNERGRISRIEENIRACANRTRIALAQDHALVITC